MDSSTVISLLSAGIVGIMGIIMGIIGWLLKMALGDRDLKIKYLESKYDDLEKDMVLVRTALAAAGANIANILSMVERVKNRIDHLSDSQHDRDRDRDRNRHDRE